MLEGAQGEDIPSRMESAGGRCPLKISFVVTCSGCGSKLMVPFWGRCATHCSLF